ncbi:MAG: Rrf2 family transcriptional regulator [Acidobacteria bacterium]|nr:Rrf2 family transcriptional regulator [Acidobacteriota bacterium]MBS1866546.1 Rrf2 family transcriptional regulator [Acidobacteriota bacterium]
MKVYASQTMRVSAKGEYATRAVLHLAMEYPEVVTIHQIAAHHRIPVKYLEQILLELRRGGILFSRRGVHGGYLLSRNPAEISIGEVLQIVDSRFIESSCDQRDSERGFLCSDPAGFELKQVWSDVRIAVERILFETSFAEVCARSVRRPPPNSSKTLARLNA